MRCSVGKLTRLRSATAQNWTVCSNRSATVVALPWRPIGVICRRGFAALDAREQKVGKTPNPRSQGFPARPVYSERVSECIPLAVERSQQRPRRDDWEPVEPLNPRNKIVTLGSGEKRISKKGKLLPLYRDWEKEFGKPRGDSRPYYRKNMGPLLMPYKENPELDTIQSLIVVEGLNDWTAVTSAINAQVFVCDGASILDHIYEKYTKKTVESFNGDVILLLDPDTAGRRTRTAVNKLMAPCSHAFISEYDAVVGMGMAYESVGIENASADSIRTALKRTKQWNSEAEQHIKFDTLYELGLVQTPSEQIEGVRLRRRFTCGFLGIGFCDCKQLLKQLNGYQFTLEEISGAVSQANVLVEEWMAHPWRLEKDYKKAQSPFQRKDTFSIPRQFLSAF